MKYQVDIPSKSVRLLGCLAVLLSFQVSAQTLSWKSNDIHIDYNEGVPAGSLPHIRWTTPALDYTSAPEGKLNIEASVESETNLVSLKMMLVNTNTGDTLATRKYDAGSRRYSIDQALNLVEDGMFYVRIVAVNEAGGRVSSRRNIIAGKDALDYISADRKDYALVFATDNYDHWDDLVNPVNDGHTVANELREKYGFETEVVENADFETVFQKLREYNERKFRPQDQLLIFFAGHGMFDETFGEGYVVAKNSAANDISRASYISHARLRGIIDNIPCEHILLMMDVCFGGTLDPVIARSRSAHEVSDREFLARRFRYKTRKYLTSGGKEYVSDGIPGKHSPFAAKLIEALRGYGGEDRILTLAELQITMEKLKQIPRFGSFGADEPLSDFVFVAKGN